MSLNQILSFLRKKCLCLISLSARILWSWIGTTQRWQKKNFKPWNERNCEFFSLKIEISAIHQNFIKHIFEQIWDLNLDLRIHIYLYQKESFNQKKSSKQHNYRSFSFWKYYSWSIAQFLTAIKNVVKVLKCIKKSIVRNKTRAFDLNQL